MNREQLIKDGLIGCGIAFVTLAVGYYLLGELSLLEVSVGHAILIVGIIVAYKEGKQFGVDTYE